mmetsp:Transcript_23062/g.53777  ORF Transcript_23062/g.53777 Transcript_23062/m.53777 type:complete len:186 (+) Transcript_23062:115-672(+)
MFSGARSTPLTVVGAVLLLIQAPDAVLANSQHLASLCKDEYCSDPAFPLLDYDNGKCVCRRHPCWNDNGQKHSCTDPEYPFLHFMYEESGDMMCKCSSIPYYESVYLARDLCPGKQCDKKEYPVLDLDEDGVTCVCRSHPCWNVAGERHECKEAGYPILRYRQDLLGRPICDCMMSLEEPDLEDL